MRASMHLSIAGGLLILHAVSSGAEELLVKETRKYLGWKIPDNKFRVCDETIVNIENGRIEKTQISAARLLLQAHFFSGGEHSSSRTPIPEL